MTILLEILFINSTMKQGSYSRMIIMLCCNSGCHMFILWQGEMKKNVFLQLDMCVYKLQKWTLSRKVSRVLMDITTAVKQQILVIMKVQASISHKMATTVRQGIFPLANYFPNIKLLRGKGRVILPDALLVSMNYKLYALLQLVPSHCSVAGNEKANKLATKWRKNVSK